MTGRGFSTRAHVLPDRDDVLMLQFSPVKPGETPDDHPAIVLTERSYNKIGIAIVCAMTSTERHNPFAVFVPPDRKCGFDGFIQVDQVRLVNFRERNPRPLGKLPADLLGEVTGLLKDLIDPVVTGAQ